ncbi:unnamed protein product [Heligmosomoides polygyrus]|uniref:Malic enzyme n=1 Tax=Heligmosomoides polygyrus TaxID=6339 RepID=A0A183GMM6_HELPZ|nr:unnamed protein product [Heligmosomoides polygyrus]
MSASKPSQSQKTSRIAMTAEDQDAVHGADEVALALEQLQADKKTPAFVKILFNHMLTVQQELNVVLAKNQELQEQVANLREENGALKAALAEAGIVSSAAQFPDVILLLPAI